MALDVQAAKTGHVQIKNYAGRLKYVQRLQKVGTG
jgi:hypothetical protein